MWDDNWKVKGMRWKGKFFIFFMSKGQLFSSISLQDYWKAFLIFWFFFFFLQIRQKVNEQHSSWLNNFLKEIPVNEFGDFYYAEKIDSWIVFFISFRYSRSVGAKHYHTTAKLNKGIEEMFLDLTKRKFYLKSS